MTITPEAAMAPLPEAYHRLFERIRAACETDERIRGLWLSGSLGRGTADSGSDLDLLLAVSDEPYDRFATEWRSWLQSITPTLLAKQIPSDTALIISSLTPELCRLDVVAEPVSLLAETPFRFRVSVIDRDDLGSRLPPPAERPGPNPGKVTTILTEFWRVQAIAPFMINDRRDLLAARSGVDLLGRMLYDLFVEANQPLPPMGAKQFSSRLTPDQRQLLESLPAYGSDAESLIVAGCWLADAMAVHGPEIAARVGVDYPHQLATTVRAHLKHVLGR